MQITPAILPHDFGELTQKLERILGFSDRIQIDLCDGVFGREKSWFPDNGEILPVGFSYEFDLMINDWRKYLPICLKFPNVTRVVAHVDTFSEQDLKDFINIISPNNTSLGVSISNDKSVDIHIEMIRKAKELYEDIFVQVMGIHVVGEQGQGFNDEALERIKKIRSNFEDIFIQVDGGIKPNEARKVKESGANGVVVGSYMFGGEDISKAFEEINIVIDN